MKKTINLNPEQKKAATHIEGPMIVLAGPGTGKTQIIAARIAHILDNTQMDPHNILCLTFTESGVVAMRKRLIELIGTAAYYVRIHTFHSFCNEVIKDFPEKFLFARELEPLTEVERIQIFQKILDDLEESTIKPFGAPYLYQNDLSHAIQNLKREDVLPEKLASVLEKNKTFLKNHEPAIQNFITTHANSLKNEDFENLRIQLKDSPLSHLFPDHELEKKERTKLKNEIKKAYLDMKNQLPKQLELVTAYKAYQAELRARGRYDFEDMILFVVQKFKEDKDLLAHYQEQFQYILVDEYQDTNGAQNEVVQLIGEFFDNPNIFVVGDDKQSIYRFQGASLENILYFYKLYEKDVETVSLKSNYRSQQTILDAAHSLIQKNEHGISKYIPNLDERLHAEKDTPATPIKIAEFDTPQSEHYFLAKKVEELIQQGTDPSEIAILYRNNWDVRDLMDIFIRLEIPFRLEAKFNILEDKSISNLLMLLEFIQDFNKEHLLFFILNFNFLHLSSLEIAKLTRTAAYKSLFEIMSDPETSPSKEFLTLSEKLFNWQRLSINAPLIEFFDHVIKESGYLDFIMSQPDKVEQLNRLNTLFDELKKMNRANHELTLKDFLDQLTLLKENNVAIKEHELKTQKNAVRLMTAHKSKGLEFEHVFLMKCVDKHWGNNPNRAKIRLPKGILKNEISKSEKNEDERRLFYTAMTRAKKTVHISYSNTNENARPVTPSIFIEEIDPEFTERIPTDTIEDEATDRLQTTFLKVPKQDHSQEEKAFISSLLENYTLSVTHLNNYLRCPRLFYYQNLLRVPSAMNKFAAFGSAVHESLKDFNIEHKKGELPSKEFLIEKFERHMKRQVLSQQDFRGGIKFGQETLGSYYDEYHDKLTPYSVSEYDFASHGVNIAGIPITGKLDKIEFPDSNAKEVHVIDYKTGNPDTKREELATNGAYWRQIVFYQLLCDNSPKFPYSMVSGEINFIQPSKRNATFRKQIYNVSHEDRQMLTATIKDVYKDIISLKFLSPDEWIACGECDYCKAFATN
jgi:DNA helicase II / ATP-dependent DNA helicase PcrA